MSDVSKTSELVAEARNSFKATNASANLIHRLVDALESVRAERDAAVAAIERVRDALKAERAWHEHLVESGEAAPRNAIGIGVVEKALDGAPEPEWEYRCTNNINTTGLLADPALHARQCSGKIERRRKAGPWLPVEGEKP